MRPDTKVRDGEIKLVPAERTGKVVWNQRVPENVVHGALDAVANWESNCPSPRFQNHER